MPEVPRRTYRTWLCGLCAEEISWPQMKRHLAAHDRHGALRADTDREWLNFLDVTGWPTSSAVLAPPVGLTPTGGRRDG